MRRLLLRHPSVFAGLWFLTAALLPISVFALLSLPSAILAPSARYLTFLCAALGAPLLVALGMGCVLGAAVARDPKVSVLSSALRGVAITLVSLVVVAIVVLVDVETTDYSFSVESSRERSVLLAQGLLLSVSVPLLLFGGLAAYLLRWYASRVREGLARTLGQTKRTT